MNLFDILNRIATQNGWPLRQDPNGEIRIEVRTQPNRTQVVTWATGNDPEGDAVAYVWSVAGHVSTARDLAAVMRFSEPSTLGLPQAATDRASAPARNRVVRVFGNFMMV